MTLASPRPRAIVQQAFLAVVALLAFADPSPAQPQTFVLFVSEEGDYIGAGQHHTFTDVTVSPLAEGVSVSAGGYYYQFQAPAGESFDPGAYEGATRYPMNDPPEPGLDVSGNGRGCNSLTGRFELHEIAYGAERKVSRLAIDFEQHCGGSVPALFGWIRFSSEVPVPDSDGDGVPDMQDNCVDAPNADQMDADLDGWGDVCDNCPLHENPDQADEDPSNGVGDVCEDTDGDGLANADEVSLHGSDPSNPDTDGDGLLDGEEVNLYRTNPLEADTDGDGLDDGEEVTLFGSSPIDFDQAWTLSGTLDTRMGSHSEGATVKGMLLLGSTRRYVIHIDGDPIQERGAWFQYQDRILLYPQNLLEMVQILEQELEAREGEPIEISVSSIRTEGHWDGRTGSLSLNADARCSASFRESDITEQFWRSLKVAGVVGSAAGAVGRRRDDAVSSPAGELAISDATSDDSALAGVPARVWDLAGTATARIGGNAERGPISAILSLNGDRTYVLGSSEGDPLPETGAWFQDGHRLLLYQQNLLEQIVALEEQIARETEEPVELCLTRAVNKASIKNRTGILSLKSDVKFDASFPRLGLSVPFSISAKAQGARRTLPR